MRAFRKRLRRAILAALPAAATAAVACSTGVHGSTNASSSNSSGASSGSTASSGTSGFGSDICSTCPSQGLVCDFWRTSCIPPCESCPCTAVVMPVVSTDGGFNDGGLPLDLCKAACPDTQFSTPDPIQLDWVVLGCGIVDGGCPSQADGGDAGASCVVCTVADCSGSGRAPEGLQTPTSFAAQSPLAAFLGRSAHLEAASVVAFERTAQELIAFGAPRSLIERARAAAHDEERHAQQMNVLAFRFGGEAPEVKVAPFEPRSLAAFAEENVREGCVRETFGAAVAEWQALHASDEQIRTTMRAIAEDEARHAELSWDIHAWLTNQLDANAREHLERVQQRALSELGCGWPLELVERAGLPSASQAAALRQALLEHVWSQGDAAA